MDRLHGFWTRLRALWRRGAVERELDDELRFHVEMEIDALVARGLSPEEARRRALVAFGGVERHKETSRDARGFVWLHEARGDLRHALRLLAAHPAFAAAVILTLALGVGANTAIFSVIDAVLLRPSPFAAPDRLVMFWETDRGSHTTHEPASWPDVADYGERARTIRAIGSVLGQDVTIGGEGEPMRVAGLGVTPELLPLLGVRPVVGRLFTPDEGNPGAQQVAMLGERFWRERYDADPAIVGRTITLDEQPATIVGVLPADADLGIRQIHDRADYAPTFSGEHVAVWLAMRPRAASYPRTTHPFLTVARLAPGATLESAQQEMSAIAADLERSYPENANRGVNLERYSDVVFGAVRPVLFVLLGAVTLVLLVTCANVANLLLARTTARAREVAMRRALGAGDGRIRRQFLVESAVLVLLGSAAGVLVAYAGLRAIVALAPAGIPRLDSASVNGTVLAYAAVLAALVALAFGMLPAVQLRRLDLHGVLTVQSGRRISEGRGGRRVRSSLVVAEVALAVMLVVGAGLLLRSLWRLQAVDPGFDGAHVLKAQYQLPGTRYAMDLQRWPDIPAVTGFHARLLQAVRAIPGVESAAIASASPLDPGFTNSFRIVGREAESEHYPEIRTRFITPGYLHTLGVPLLAGRDIRDGDDARAPSVVLINRTAAERYFGAGAGGAGTPIGQVIQFWGTPWRIVGVIGDERFRGVDAPPDPAVYAPLAQAPQQSVTLLVRARGPDPASLAPAVRRALHAADPQLALFGVEPLRATLSESIARPRFSAVLLALFGGVAMALALVGVYGVLGYTVAQRVPEMGIRLALGAARWDVMRVVVGEGIALAAGGVAIGLLAALAGSRILSALVFGVTTTDPATFITVAGAVLLTALLATILPALRATRADPMLALRAE
ncbi:MAG TPA: ABC transporter permease [Gemmatimonadaceae bacterium]|nr:ABC transporter permease [Gemmatimonadaceae bacterium]